jgi:hypothetical protein
MTRLSLWAAVLGTAAMAVAAPALAQNFVLDGHYGCARATNGRTYCRRQGVATYVPVTEEFFTRYETMRTGVAPAAPAAAPQPVVVQQQQVNNVNIVVQTLGREYADLDGQIAILSSLIEEERSLTRSGGEPQQTGSETIAAIEARLGELRTAQAGKLREAGRYQTSIRPNDFDQYISARKMSEVFPKIPYYVPGTKEVGEFWLEPQVRDDGALVFRMRFIDPTSKDDRTRSSIEMTPDEVNTTRVGLLKLSTWSFTAHENKIRRSFEKRAACFPVQNCPEEGQKRDGVASTEIVFTVNEDGSTGGRFQRNKGRYEESYGISIESARLLQAYLRRVLREGRREYNAGSQSREELGKLFN